VMERDVACCGLPCLVRYCAELRPGAILRRRSGGSRTDDPDRAAKRGERARLGEASGKSSM
jgi:hypothetical protein